MRVAIARKRDGGRLEAAQWENIVADFLRGTVDDAQMAALAMACVVRGMDVEETRALTRSLVASGDTLVIEGLRAVDKHSSGGVADTASLIVVPLVAACGVPVAKLSGRALGHTGGTLDKLEAIPGLRTDLEPQHFLEQVRVVGCAIAAQSARLVPGDKKLYALRDRTGTIPSIGLIAASIVSKKIAGGAHAIVYDVKAGRGAFMQCEADARLLAQTLVEVTVDFGRRARALVTDMNEPLGRAIGTGLEVIEAREFLAGAPARNENPRLAEVCRRLAAALIEAGDSGGGTDAGQRIDAALADGAALDFFERMLVAQGAARGALAALAPHPRRTPVAAACGGYVRAIDCVALGEIARDLVGRDGPGAGLRVHARIGAALAAGQLLAEVFGTADLNAAVGSAFELDEEPPPPRPLVYADTAVR